MADNLTMFSNRTSQMSCRQEVLDSKSYHYDLNISIIVINTPFAIFAVLSNLLVIITICKSQELRVPANILLCSLAVTDLLVGLITQPLFITWRLMLHYSSTICNSEVVHSLYEAFLHLCTGSSFLCLAYLSTDRFLAVSKPLHYRANTTTTKVARNMIILWFVWIGIVVLRYSGIDEKTNATITSVIAGTLVIYLVIAQIALIVSVKRNSIHDLLSEESAAVIASKREARIASTIIYIFLALLVFLLPAVVVQIVSGFTSSNQSKIELNFAISALLINSSANPLIYFWRGRDMRKAARLLFPGPTTKSGAADSNRSSNRTSGDNSGRSLEETI
ncbi:trace amine-associated receptor 7h-like [Stylophora pistillata]|uniref:trace amine-associated receptor 7h-like n=1 Tax=Stylophora pistillata TaxID=50429 RepID=UPI000C049B8D|nr:trace amine-associated receptor 7h-like [Stylophora pistillata]XP_022783864.1 trace amine-associated receptor 7h-like [Stylophora pistillata]